MFKSKNNDKDKKSQAEGKNSSSNSIPAREIACVYMGPPQPYRPSSPQLDIENLFSQRLSRLQDPERPQVLVSTSPSLSITSNPFNVFSAPPAPPPTQSASTSNQPSSTIFTTLAAVSPKK